MQVWVVTTHSGYGEDSDVLGIYESREAAWDGLKAALPPAHKMWVSDDGTLRAKPEDEYPGLRYHHCLYAVGEQYEVQGRARIGRTREDRPAGGDCGGAVAI